MSQITIDRVVEQLQGLPESHRQQVLEYARKLRAEILEGVPGEALVQFAGTIPADDLQQMEKAIEQGCEQICR